MMSHMKGTSTLDSTRKGLGTIVAVLLLACTSAADEPDRNGTQEEEIVTDDVPAAPGNRSETGRGVLSKTLGGRQFWADVQFFHQWRIQRNVLTGHYRLLDEDDYRHASGTLEECRQALADIREADDLPPMSGEAVILIHGLIRSPKSMSKLKRRLRIDQDGFQTFSFGYPSTQVDIAESAEYLHQVIESLEGIERIHFVVHSMGGLVVRAYLAGHDEPRLGRMVMIATPNQGAELADRFHRNVLFRALYGKAGQQLTRDPDGFIAGLPVPGFEFGVIAGGRGTARGYNPLIPGDDDGTVSVDSTRLEGAADFVVVDRLHTFLVADDQTREYTIRFLKEGRFREEDERQPIP